MINVRVTSCLSNPSFSHSFRSFLTPSCQSSSLSLHIPPSALMLTNRVPLPSAMQSVFAWEAVVTGLKPVIDSGLLYTLMPDKSSHNQSFLAKSTQVWGGSRGRGMDCPPLAKGVRVMDYPPLAMNTSL